MREYSLKISLLSSCTVHVVLFMLAASVIQQTPRHRQELLMISLFDTPPPETTSDRKIALPLEIRNLPAAPPTLSPLKEEPAKANEAEPSVTAKADSSVGFTSPTRIEGGGSEAGAGNLYGKGDVAVVPGSVTAGGGGGTAGSGLGRGSGPPGLPAQTVLRTNRKAKPIQTVRAAYPAMALRMGLESDVTLRIEVDTEGRVTKAEITETGGAGFDEEALKAVKQSRFEPAQRDGHNIPAEFTYIYRFRLQR